MADVRTNIKISADTKEVKKVGVEVGKAFSPTSVKQFQQATRDLEKQFTTLIRKQTDLAKQLEAAKKGTDAYKSLNKELKDTAKQTDLVLKTVSQLDRISQRQERQARTSKGRSFFGGMVQGLGIAQYMPNEPGQVQRTAGALIGGGIRRGVGIAGAPFSMPGVAGMSQALGMLPGVGPMAAAGLSTLGASYQEAVGYQRAQLQNLYFANAKTTRGLSAGEVARRKSAATAANSELSAFNATDFKKDPALLSEGVRISRLAHKYSDDPEIADALRSMGNEKRMEAREGGRAFRDATRGKLSAAAARAQRRAGVTTETTGGLGPLETGHQLGLGPQQVQEMMGEFMRMRGGRLNQGQFNESMAAQTVFGVSQGQTGMFARGGMAGAGMTGGANLTTTLRTAVVEGLEGSQVSEYLDTLVKLSQAAEQRGIKINASEFSKMSLQLSQSGFQGLQASRVAGGFTGAAQGLAQRGVQGPLDVLMLRAAGFEPGQGMEGYAAAMEKLQNPDADLMRNVLGSITKGAGGMGKKGQALVTMRALGKMGINVGMGQASDLINTFQTTGGMGPDITGKLARVKGGGLMEEAGALVRKNAPETIRAAGLERARIATGMAPGTGKVMEGFELNSLKAATAVGRLNASFDMINGSVGKFMGTVDKAAESLQNWINGISGGAGKHRAVPHGAH